MVDYLRNTSDEVTKTEVVKRIGELAERFAPDTQWFLDTMNQVCCCNLPVGSPACTSVSSLNVQMVYEVVLLALSCGCGLKLVSTLSMVMRYACPSGC